MTSKTVKAGPVATGTDLRNADQRHAINSENNLEVLRKQYLSEAFDLPADTACVLAELVFGEGGR